MLAKSFYRYPLIIGLPNFYKENLPNRIRENKKMQVFCCGFSVAFVESFILCPFERLRTYFMTQENFKSNESKISQYLKDVKSGLIRDLFKGIGPLIIRQIVAWVFFLEADLFAKQTLR